MCIRDSLSCSLEMFGQMNGLQGTRVYLPGVSTIVLWFSIAPSWLQRRSVLQQLSQRVEVAASTAVAADQAQRSGGKPQGAQGATAVARLLWCGRRIWTDPCTELHTEACSLIGDDTYLIEANPHIPRDLSHECGKKIKSTPGITETLLYTDSMIRSTPARARRRNIPAGRSDPLKQLACCVDT